MKTLKLSALLLSGTILQLTGCGKDNDPVAVSSVVVTPVTLEINPGQTAQLTAKITPGNAHDKIVTWSSANRTIATVDVLGKVTAASSGQTTITATAGGKSASCAVTVKTPTQVEPDTGIGGWGDQGNQSDDIEKQ